MTTDKEKIIEKIRKLLALGESDNMHEAELALARASDLMRDYQIKEAEIHKDEGGYKVEIQDHTIILPLGGCPWTRKIAGNLARAFCCKPIFLDYYPGTTRAHYKVQIFGDMADVATVRLLMQYAFETVARFEKAEWRKVLSGEISTHLTKTSYIHSYRVGVASGMAEVLKRIRDENRRKGQKTLDGKNNTYALILQNKTALTAQVYKTAHPSTSNISNASTYNPAGGRHRGHADGKGVNFGGRSKNSGYLG